MKFVKSVGASQGIVCVERLTTHVFLCTFLSCFGVWDWTQEDSVHAEPFICLELTQSSLSILGQEKAETVNDE